MYYSHKCHTKFVKYYKEVMTLNMEELKQKHGNSVGNIPNFIQKDTWNYIAGLTQNLTKKQPNTVKDSEHFNYLAYQMVRWHYENNNVPDHIAKGDYYKDLYPTNTIMARL